MKNALISPQWRKLGLTAGVALSITSTNLLADEGMWTVDNFPASQIADQYGTVVEQGLLDKLRLSTTRVEGGCTGSFASPDGLVLTNHHCIQRCLTQLSSEENDVRAKGFVAGKRADEQRCESEQLSVLIDLEDVTDKVNLATSGLSEEEANRTRKSTLTELENACKESAGDTISVCEAVTLYQGGQYFLYKYKRYDDIRLVFAPEQSIAAFGGDPDNFNFPRWCLDMALLRAYEDGKPAMSPDYLRWNRAGAEKGETVFVSGHPGSTQRLISVAELQMLRDTRLPKWIERNAELRGRIIQFGKTGDEQARVANGVLQGLENGLKVQRNRLSALLSQDGFSAKLSAEQALRDAIMKDPELREKYAASWNDIDRAVDEYRNVYTRYSFVESGAGFSGNLFSYARTLVRAAAEREKPEGKRLRAYTDNRLPKVKQRLLAARPISADLEKLRMSFSLDKLRETLGPDDYFVKLVLKKNSPDALAERLVDGSSLADPAVREKLWEGGQAAIDASTDPMIELARAIDPEARSLR
ncbi:MAG: S46 family peptidase, partial [Pseudomonadota bacterium]